MAGFVIFLLSIHDHIKMNIERFFQLANLSRQNNTHITQVYVDSSQISSAQGRTLNIGSEFFLVLYKVYTIETISLQI